MKHTVSPTGKDDSKVRGTERQRLAANKQQNKSQKHHGEAYIE